MKSFSPLLATLTMVICASCSSEQIPGEPEAAPSPDSSPAKSAPAEIPIVLETHRNVGVTRSGITPMDVTTGEPGTTTTPSQTTGTEAASTPPPGLPPTLSNGNRTFRMVRSGKAAPGEGPKGPDGKVVDPQVYLEQMKQQQAQKAAEAAPKPPSSPNAAPQPPSLPREIKRLDPSEAPKLPRAAAPQKAK